MTTKCIVHHHQPLTQEALTEIVHRLKEGREVIGSYGESRFVVCPQCGCNQYPVRKAVARCSDCGQLYRIPAGYSSPLLKHNQFLNNLLSGEQRDAGLHLVEEDDHTVSLRHYENIIAHFTHHVTVENLRHEADQWLNETKSGITFAQV